MTQELFAQALQAEKSNDFVKADQLCDEALRQRESYDALLAGARIAKALGNHVKACERLEHAFRLQPSANLRFQLAVSYMDSGNLAAAEELVRERLKKKAKDSTLVNLYGVILKNMERYEEAIEFFNQAAKLDGKNISPPVNMGNTYMLLDKPAQAVACFTKATRLAPKDGEYFRLLASAYSRLGEYAKALSILQQALARSPKDPRIRLDITAVYMSLKEHGLALQQIDRALTLFPDHLDLLRRKAILLRQMGRNDDALQLFEELLQRYPNDDETLIALGNFYVQFFGDREKANTCYSKALQSNASNVKAAMHYCECLVNSRYGNEAEHIEKAYEVALGLLRTSKNSIKIAEAVYGVFLRTADYESVSRLGERKKLLRHWVNQMNVGELHNQLGRVETMEDRLDLVALHREWGGKTEAIAARNPIVRNTPFLSSGKVAVGIMSSDLRDHPVSYFALPILELYDRRKFEIYCYSFYPKEPDRVQQKITQIVDGFYCLPDLSDHAIAQKMADDGLDILFELGGTTHLNKVQVCAYRPAPVQVSWLGYPHSSGLPTIDYILVDPYINPEDAGLLIEKPFMMPDTWVSLGKLGFIDIPIEAGVPEERNGWITFGTANNPYKYTPKVFETWAMIMRQVPQSRFLFIRPEGAVKYFKENVARIFASHGIEAERILFAPVRGKHMPYYNQIDIALDPFPHVGGTTTCETIWMGVPVVTLVGPALFERLSYSNLMNAGLGDLCAFDVPSYVSKALALANDKERRRYLRHNLRQQIREHPLGRAERFVRNFENKILEVLGKS